MAKTDSNFEYVVAALNLKVTKQEAAVKTVTKKKNARKPDGNIRPSTKLVLIVLINHRNNKTGQCNPSHKRLMDETGYSKRTIVFELQALKELSIVNWERGWGNEHAKQANRYSFDLSEIKKREHTFQDADDEGAVGTDEGAVGAMKVHSTTDEGALWAPLTSKGTSNTEPTNPEPARPLLFTQAKEPSTAGSWSHLQNEVSAPDAPSYESAPDAPTKIDPFPSLNWERGYGWGARRDIGRALTAEEVTEMKERNAEHLTPEEVTA